MGQLTITRGSNWIIYEDSVEGVVGYEQLLLSSGSNGANAVMPNTSTGLAPINVIAGQRASNTPIAINNVVSINATGANIYGKYVRTNANIPTWASAIRYTYIKGGSWETQYGKSKIVGGDSGTGRFMEFYEGDEKIRVVQCMVATSGTSSPGTTINLPVAMPDTTYTTFGTKSATFARYVVATAATSTTQMTFQLWNAGSPLAASSNYLLAVWIKGA